MMAMMTMTNNIRHSAVASEKLAKKTVYSPLWAMVNKRVFILYRTALYTNCYRLQCPVKRRPSVNGYGLCLLFSNQKRSPNLRLWNCLARMHVNVGPSIVPVNESSEMPAGQRSTSSTCLHRCHAQSNIAVVRNIFRWGSECCVVYVATEWEYKEYEIIYVIKFEVRVFYHVRAISM